MQDEHVCPLSLFDMPIHCPTWVHITCWQIPLENCQWKEIHFYPSTDLYFNQEPITLQAEIQLKHDATIEKLQPTSLHDMVAINNNYKASKNTVKTNEDKKTKQILLQIRLHNRHLKVNTKIEKYKKETEQHFYDETQSRTQLYFKEPSSKHS